MSYDIGWAKVDLKKVPKLVTTEIPGPKSKELHARATKIMKGLSGQVKLFPVVFESGYGCTLTDADGNVYLDFSSGIYVTTLGHCHPKVSEAVAKYAKQLMNAHDFTTPIKVKLLEKMTEILPKGLTAVQLYDSGTTAVEAGIRVCRAVTGKSEFLSFYGDFHGKSGHSASLARMNATNGTGRAQGFYMMPRPNPYRPLFKKADGSIDTDAYIAFFDEFVTEATTGQVAAVVLEPVQGWAGSIFPPDDFFPKLRAWCDKKKYLLFADEVLTSIGRTGKFLATEHWNTVPDVLTLGQGLRQRLPRDGDGRALRLRRAVREDQRLHQLRRQPHGLRRGAGIDRGNPGGGAAGEREAPGGLLREAAGVDEGLAQDHRRRALQGLPHGRGAGEGQDDQGAIRRGGQGWSTSPPSARAWRGSPRATSCA